MKLQIEESRVSLDSNASMVTVSSILSLPEYTDFFGSDTPTQEHFIKAETILRQIEVKDAMDRALRGDIKVGEVLFALLKHAPTDNGRRHVACVIRVVEMLYAYGDAAPYNVFHTIAESWWLYFILPSKHLPSSQTHSHSLTMIQVEATGRQRAASTVSTEIFTPTLQSTNGRITLSSRNEPQRLEDLVCASHDV